jgi:anti-sigma factor RsiW
MRQELIDLLLGELEPEAAEALKERVRREPALAKELGQLEALRALMRRGEEIEPSPEMRQMLVAEAERRTAPSLWQQLRQLPGLLQYRFQHSLRFRVATVSLGIHLAAMVVLSIVLIEGPRANRPPVQVTWKEEEAPIQRPASEFSARLAGGRLFRGRGGDRLRSAGPAGGGQQLGHRYAPRPRASGRRAPPARSGAGRGRPRGDAGRAGRGFWTRLL